MKETEIEQAKKRKYAVLSAQDMNSLERLVSSFMDEGFVPTGSFTYAPQLPGKDNYFQAVYKPKA